MATIRLDVATVTTLPAALRDLAMRVWRTRTYSLLRQAADEIERLRADRDKFETAWQDVSDRYESLLNQLGATDA